MKTLATLLFAWVATIGIGVSQVDCSEFKVPATTWCESIKVTAPGGGIRFSSDSRLLSGIPSDGAEGEFGFGGDARGLLRSWFDMGSGRQGLAIVEIPDLDSDANGIPDIYEPGLSLAFTNRGGQMFFGVLPGVPATNHLRLSESSTVWTRRAGSAVGTNVWSFSVPELGLETNIVLRFEVSSYSGVYRYRPTLSPVPRRDGRLELRSEPAGNRTWSGKLDLTPGNEGEWNREPTRFQVPDATGSYKEARCLASDATVGFPLPLRRMPRTDRYVGQYFLEADEPGTPGKDAFDYWSLRIDFGSPPLPTLAVSRTNTGTGISVSYCHGVLQYAEQITGPWMDLPTGVNPFVQELGKGDRFFRVRS